MENGIQNGQAKAKRLVKDFTIAQSSWAYWEAINGETEVSRQKFRKAISNVSGWPNGLTAALLRDTLMAFSRIVDKSGSASLCRIRKCFEDTESDLIERAQKHAKHEADLIEAKIAEFKKWVPKQWNGEPPQEPLLYHWRGDIEKLRNNSLAHSNETYSLNKIQIDKIRRGFKLLWPLVRDAHHIFDGSPPPGNMLCVLTENANNFWNYAEVGFIQANEKQNREREIALTKVQLRSK